MAPETRHSGKGYLRRSLAQGVEPFHFRSGVRALLGLPDSSGVEMNAPPSFPVAGFTYAFPQFSGEFEIPDEFFQSAHGRVSAAQMGLSSFTATAPQAPALPERQSPRGSRAVPAKQPSSATRMPAPATGAPTATGLSELPKTAPTEVRREYEASEDRTEKLPVSLGAQHTLRKETVVADGLVSRLDSAPVPRLVSRRHEEILPDRTRGKDVKRVEPANGNRAGSEIHNSATLLPPTLATESSSAHIPTQPAGQPSLSAPSTVNIAIPPRATKGHGPVAPFQARQVREEFPQSMPPPRTPPLVAKSLPQLRQEKEASPIAPGISFSPQSESRHNSLERRLSENRRQAPPDTFVTRHTPAEPAAQAPVVLVTQSSEAAPAAFWERRYLSHLHLRMRR
jgi:hypothetical protein